MFDFIEFEEFKILAPKPEETKPFGETLE